MTAVLSNRVEEWLNLDGSDWILASGILSIDKHAFRVRSAQTMAAGYYLGLHDDSYFKAMS